MIAPLPTHFFWLRRFGVLGVVLLIAVGVTQIFWGHTARSRLEQRLAALRARGESVDFEDFAPASAAAADNAATLYKKAFALIVEATCGVSNSNEEFKDYPPYPPLWHVMLEESENAHGELFCLVRAARDLPGVDWQVTYPSDNPAAVRLPQLNLARATANLVGDGLMYAHSKGNDAEAVERARDVLRLGRAVSEPPMLVCSLVGVGIDALACARIQSVAATLNVEGDAFTPGGQPATRAQIHALIADLLDEKHRVPVSEYVSSERMMSVQTLKLFGAKSHVMRPLIDLVEVNILDQRAPEMEVARADDLRAAALAFQKARGGVSGSNGLAPRTLKNWWLAPFGGWSLDRYFETVMRCRSERRMTAVTLATRLYWIDHHAWPAALNDLVPAHLSSVPLDSMQPGHLPLGYVVLKNVLPDGADRPLVISGSGGALTTTPPPEPMHDWMNTTVQMRDLADWAPPAHVQAMRAAATQPLPDRRR